MPGVDPMGRHHFWFAVEPLRENEPGTDLWAMENDYVSITPLRLDLTNYAALKQTFAEQPLEGPDPTAALRRDPALAHEGG